MKCILAKPFCVIGRNFLSYKKQATGMRTFLLHANRPSCAKADIFYFLKSEPNPSNSEHLRQKTDSRLCAENPTAYCLCRLL